MCRNVPNPAQTGNNQQVIDLTAIAATGQCSN
jgi:hypothetical protein